MKVTPINNNNSSNSKVYFKRKKVVKKVEKAAEECLTKTNLAAGVALALAVNKFNDIIINISGNQNPPPPPPIIE